MAIGVSVYAYDYDSVYFFSANRDEMLANRERGTSGDLWFIWEVNPGDGNILPPIFPWSPQAIYIPPTLNPGEQERTVTLRCTVVDVSPDWSRRDQPVIITRSIRIVNRPTVHLSVYAVDDQGNGISSTPIPSGQLLPSRLRFTAYKRGTSWNLESVTFDTPWGTYSVAPPYGESFVSFTIPALPPDESHRRFEFGASAVFSIILPPPVGRIEQRDEKRMESLLGFDMTDRFSLNEMIDPSRGHWIYWDEGRDVWVYDTFPVPNWFHNRSGHWGNVIPRFNEEYTYGSTSYPIVHWFENDDLEDDRGNQIVSVMDWSGEFADVVGPDQGGNRWTEPYRGRIYLSKRLITHAAELRNETYGLVTDGIDLVARVVAHEFFHRDQFLAAWGGFSDAHIGPLTLPRPTFWPGNPRSGYDSDGDLLRNEYEVQMHNIYHTNSADRYAVLKWWTGKQIAAGPDEYYFDAEMCARLWGEWNGYWVGSLDSQDWSVGGRQDYEGGN